MDGDADSAKGEQLMPEDRHDLADQQSALLQLIAKEEFAGFERRTAQIHQRCGPVGRGSASGLALVSRAGAHRDARTARASEPQS